MTLLKKISKLKKLTETKFQKTTLYIHGTLLNFLQKCYRSNFFLKWQQNIVNCFLKNKISLLDLPFWLCRKIMFQKNIFKG